MEILENVFHVFTQDDRKTCLWVNVRGTKVTTNASPCSYLSAVPGPPHQDHKFSMEHLEPPGGGTDDLQQQTVAATGHGHVRRSEHSFGMTEITELS